MKLSFFKSVLVAFGFVACLLTMSSCNKGYGCPADFSVEASIEIPAQVIPSC
ncbi:MAG TPA: hypothetical protein VFF90_01075 [Saprospiraceae bacterium]|nr:hypothetical protein [Saprospiraceae bacterium]